MVTATYTVELATENGADPATWSDITAYVKSVSVTRGRDDVLSQMQAGTAQVVLVNDDGRFNPAHSSSPLYGHVTTMRAVRVRATHASTTYDLYRGHIQSISPNLAPNVRECTLALSDGFAWLDLAVTTPTYSAAASGTSIGVALDSASWPAGLRSLATGQSTFTPSYSDTSVLAQVQGIGIDNEAGLVYMDGAGAFVFEDRHTRLKAPYTTSQATLTDTDAIQAMDAERPVRDLANEVKVTHATGTETASDATSIAAKGLRRLAINAPFIGASEAADRAAWTLSTRKDDADRPVVSMVANASAALMTTCLARDLSDRITISDTSSLSGLSADYHIERIEHLIGAGGTSHVTRWQLSPANAAAFWALDSGALGTTTRLAY